MLQDLPLGGFAPDQDPAQPGSFQSCVGYESTTRGWRLQRAVTTAATSATASKWPMDGFVSNTADGTQVIHFSMYHSGSLFEWLYRVNGGALTDSSRGGNYTFGSQFSFSQYGNYTLATNYVDVLQIRDASGSSAFADSAATNIPKAKICFTWGPPTAPRTMLLYYNDGTAYTDGWWSSHKGGPTLAWTPDVATEACNGRLLGAGALTCGIGFRDDAVAFSANEMWVGTYLGTGIIVEWHKIASDIGCVGSKAACVSNGILYFVGKQGLFAYDGSYPRKVNLPIQKWLVDQLSASSTGASYTTLHIDPNGQRLLLTLRSVALGLPGASTYALSINLMTNQVGMLSGIYVPLNYRYRLDGNSINSSVLLESTSPITTTTNYIELPRMGSDGAVTRIGRVYPRFAVAPTSFGVTYASAAAMSDTFTFVAESISPITTSPWRMDLQHSAKWHGLRIYTNSNGTADPELIALSADVKTEGKE